MKRLYVLDIFMDGYDEEPSIAEYIKFVEDSCEHTAAGVKIKLIEVLEED